MAFFILAPGKDVQYAYYILSYCIVLGYYAYNPVYTLGSPVGYNESEFDVIFTMSEGDGEVVWR